MRHSVSTLLRCGQYGGSHWSSHRLMVLASVCTICESWSSVLLGAEQHGVGALALSMGRAASVHGRQVGLIGLRESRDELTAPIVQQTLADASKQPAFLLSNYLK